MQIQNKLPKLLIISVLLAGTFSGCAKEKEKEEITLDPFEYVTVTFEGYNREGTAKVDENFDEMKTSKYDYLDDFIDSIEVTYVNLNNLQNGDTYEVSIEYDEDMAEENKVTIKKDISYYDVDGLEERTETIDGIEVPSVLSDEEKQIYIDNMKTVEESDSDFYVRTGDTRYHGTGIDDTLEDKTFENYKEAYEYADRSCFDYEIIEDLDEETLDMSFTVHFDKD